MQLIMASLMLVLILANCRPFSFGQAVIAVDPAKTYQTMTGREATAQAGQDDSPAFAKYRDALIDQAAELGINRLRVESRAGLENPRDWWSERLAGRLSDSQLLAVRYEAVNDNDDPFVINWSGFHFAHLDYAVDSIVLPLKRRLESRGERLFINVNYVNFGKSGFQQFNAPEEYAEFVLATYIHLQDKYGWVPDSWEVALEPDNTSFSGKQIGEAIVATARRLRAHGFRPSFVAPSTTDALRASSYFDEITNIPGAAPEISEISYHRYHSATNEALSRIKQRVEKFSVKSGMLEFIGADYKRLHQDIKEALVSSWQQYCFAYPTKDDGAQYFVIDDSDSARPVVTMGTRTRFLQQYFKYIRLGAVRLGATSDNGAVDP